MPRSGWVKPESDRPLSDLVSVGLLTRVFPPGLVDEVIAETGRTEQRRRTLPARSMAYFAIGMALYSEGHHHTWPQPDRPPTHAIHITNRTVLGLTLQLLKP